MANEVVAKDLHALKPVHWVAIGLIIFGGIWYYHKYMKPPMPASTSQTKTS